MIRRNLLAGAAAGAGFASALRLRVAAAQQSAAGAGSMSPERTSQMALGGMAFALATSELANGRAENAVVRTFAQLEAEEQNAFAEARRMAGLPVPAPSMMDGQKQQMVQQLHGLRGAEFDRMYVQGQIMGHRELLQLHQAMAQSGSRPEERMLATVAVPAIKSHLSMLQGIQQMRS
jgi:putative membrane protein